MSQTTTNNCAQPITLSDLERIRYLILSTPPPQKEMRLHPSDVEYLRTRYGTFQVAPNALATIRIIEDAEAPLLPRGSVSVCK